MTGGSSPIDLLANEADTAPLGRAQPQRRNYARRCTPVHRDFVAEGIEEVAQRLVTLDAALEQRIADRGWGRMASTADPNSVMV